MPLKDVVNTVLTRATGYRLTRETPEQRQAAMQRAAKEAAKRARQRAVERHRKSILAREARHQQQLAQQKARLTERARLKRKNAREKRERDQARQEARQASGANLPSHLDADKSRIIAKVSPRTMTGVPKLDPLVEATRFVVRNRVPGHVVECGVWRGGSMQAVALTLLSMEDTTRELHLFDTFEGMPPPTVEDTRKQSNGDVLSAADALARADRESRVWAVAGLDDVREGMQETGYPEHLVHFHPGLVEETTPDQAPDQIAILRLDTDWYASTKHELEHLYERLSPGGVLILDDYGDWDGARKATDEWLESLQTPLFLVPIGPGRIAIKPPAGR